MVKRKNYYLNLFRMLEETVNKLQKISRSAITIYPLVSLISAFATKTVLDISDDGKAASDILYLWLGAFAPISVVVGIIVWLMNEVFPKMTKTIVILFLIGAILSAWLGATLTTIEF